MRKNNYLIRVDGDRTTTPCANLPLSYLSISGNLEKMKEELGGGLAFLCNVIGCCSVS